MKYNIVFILVILLSFTSCIKKINLYEGKGEDNKENGNGENDGDADNSTPIYIYPFEKEVNNITAEITIHTNKELTAKDLATETPYLKYNKSWLLMLTQDDCSQSAFCRTWAAINGKTISSSTQYPTPTVADPNSKHDLYFDVRHLYKGDLPPTVLPADKSLGCTDGTGNEVRFAITTTLAPEEKWMTAESDVKLGFKGNYYRFYRKSGLIWDNVKEMLNYGTGIAYHNVKATDEKDPAQILEHLERSKYFIDRELAGRVCKLMAEPDGNKAYITAAKQFEDILTMTAQAGATKLYPFQIASDDLHQASIEREFNDSPDYFKTKVNTLLKSPKEQRNAIYIGVHNTDNSWVDFLTWINDSYGKDGDDSVWFPSQEEYYEYNYLRVHGSSTIEQIAPKTYKLTIVLPGKENFYYPSTTINVKGLNRSDIVSIESDGNVTGLSYGQYQNGTMLNIDCRKFLVEHATHFVERYEADRSDKSKKADATYFVSMLKDSETKKNLLNRIN